MSGRVEGRRVPPVRLFAEDLSSYTGHGSVLGLEQVILAGSCYKNFVVLHVE